MVPKEPMRVCEIRIRLNNGLALFAVYNPQVLRFSNRKLFIFAEN